MSLLDGDWKDTLVSALERDDNSEKENKLNITGKEKSLWPEDPNQSEEQTQGEELSKWP